MYLDSKTLIEPWHRKRFSRLSQFLPFLPVFGGGISRFQPVYVDDLAQAVEIITRNDDKINELVTGKYLDAGGPEGKYAWSWWIALRSTYNSHFSLVFTYRELMQLVLKYNRRTRPIISLPFEVGILQGSILEKLPKNLFTVTKAQVSALY